MQVHKENPTSRIKRTHMPDDRGGESPAYYASHGAITDPGPRAADFAGLPADVRALTRAVQGLVFHYMADEKILGWRPPKDRLPEIDTRRVRPLGEARPPERRLIGCCRDFTVLLCAMARHHRIPVRARVGFARYFVPDFHVDHEIVEWWDSGERRWRPVDPELYIQNAIASRCVSAWHEAVDWESIHFVH